MSEKHESSPRTRKRDMDMVPVSENLRMSMICLCSKCGFRKVLCGYNPNSLKAMWHQDIEYIKSEDNMVSLSDFEPSFRVSDVQVGHSELAHGPSSRSHSQKNLSQSCLYFCLILPKGFRANPVGPFRSSSCKSLQVLLAHSSF